MSSSHDPVIGVFPLCFHCFENLAVLRVIQSRSNDRNILLSFLRRSEVYAFHGVIGVVLVSLKNSIAFFVEKKTSFFMREQGNGLKLDHIYK